MSLLLTAKELAELTGKRNRDAQARVLRFVGIEHKVRPDGSIMVLLAHVEQVLAGSGRGGRIRKTEPNFQEVKT